MSNHKRHPNLHPSSAAMKLRAKVGLHLRCPQPRPWPRNPWARSSQTTCWYVHNAHTKIREGCKRWIFYSCHCFCPPVSARKVPSHSYFVFHSLSWKVVYSYPLHSHKSAHRRRLRTGCCALRLYWKISYITYLPLYMLFKDTTNNGGKNILTGCHSLILCKIYIHMHNYVRFQETKRSHSGRQPFNSLEMKLYNYLPPSLHDSY